MKERWFVAHTLPRKEFLATLQLTQQGFASFMPSIQTVQRHARRTKITKSPLFPRYAFVRLDLSRDRWRSINSTIGVSSLVMAQDLPCPVPEGIVEDLLARVNTAGLVDLADALQPGDRVQLARGPFAGAVGTLMRLDAGGRVEMLLQLMYSSVRVSTERGMIITHKDPAS